MVWVEIVCDGCNNSPYGETYMQGSDKRLKDMAKREGWKTIKGKIYCTECQLKLKKNIGE